MHRIEIIGFGTAGIGIAKAMLHSGFTVILIDKTKQFLSGLRSARRLTSVQHRLFISRLIAVQSFGVDVHFGQSHSLCERSFHKPCCRLNIMEKSMVNADQPCKKSGEDSYKYKS
jgi:hypothetical protein